MKVIQSGLIFSLLISVFPVTAQVKLQYDDAGNRIRRIGVLLPDLTPAQFFSSTQLVSGQSVKYVIAISNVGSAPTSGPLEFTVTNYSPVTGLSITVDSAPSVVIDGETFPLSNSEFTTTITSSRITFQSASVIPASSYKFIGLIVSRSGGSPGTVNSTVTIINGTGGSEFPYTNNIISNLITKN
jgi:hypothetical protein